MAQSSEVRGAETAGLVSPVAVLNKMFKGMEGQPKLAPLLRDYDFISTAGVRSPALYYGSEAALGSTHYEIEMNFTSSWEEFPKNLHLVRVSRLVPKDLTRGDEEVDSEYLIYTPKPSEDHNETNMSLDSAGNLIITFPDRTHLEGPAAEEALPYVFPELFPKITITK